MNIVVMYKNDTFNFYANTKKIFKNVKKEFMLNLKITVFDQKNFRFIDFLLI